MDERYPYALPAGHRLEEYEIVRVLGAGGFGITYLAFDHQLDGPVAIKEYYPAEVAVRADGWRVVASSADRREVFAWGLERFTEEARSIHRFRHPNVVRVHRYVAARGTAYIVMEYVEGESLKEILDARGPLSPTAWRRWLDPLLDGLAHVHGHGYLHRDLKPANIMIRAADGEPVLIDFGAARAATRERTHTRGELTPEYAPIEQHGREGTQGPPTDIYALAAVSYRALTGAPPPSAPDRVADARYEPLSGRATGPDRAWLAAIDQGLSLRPADRPQTVAAWRTALIPAHNEPAEADAAASASATSSRSWKARTAGLVTALAPSEAAASATLSRFWHGTGSSDDHPAAHNPAAASQRIAVAAQSAPDAKAASKSRARTWSGLLVAAACAAFVLWLSAPPGSAPGDSSATPAAHDMTTALAVTDVITGWLDVGLDDRGRNKLVPAIAFRLRNESDQRLGTLQLNGVFRRCQVLYHGQPEPDNPVSPPDEEAGTCLGEDQEWGSALVRAVGRDGVVPGDNLGPFTMESGLGYTGEQLPAEMLRHRDFVDVKIELFVKHRAEQWAKLSEHQIDRRLANR